MIVTMIVILITFFHPKQNMFSMLFLTPCEAIYFTLALPWRHTSIHHIFLSLPYSLTLLPTDTQPFLYLFLALQYSTVQYSTVQYSTVQYSTVQYSTVQYSTVQYNTVQYNTVHHLPAICASCEWRSWRVLFTMSPTTDDRDSKISSTSKLFSLICIRSTPASDASILSAVVWNVLPSVLRGNGVCINVSIIFIGCIINFSIRNFRACAVCWDL